MRTVAGGTVAALAVLLLAFGTRADASAPLAINTPVPAKKLSAGAIYQAPLSALSCVGVGRRAVLGRQRCTRIPELAHIDATVRPVVAADSKALYIAAQDGVLVLRRTAAGGLAYDSCAQVTGPCGGLEDGNTITSLLLAPGGRTLYVTVDRQRDGGVEIHPLPIGTDDRLTAAPGCLLRARIEQYSELPNPRNCLVDAGYDHAQTYGLTLAPDGRFAYVITAGPDTTGIAEFSVNPDATLAPAPGCVSDNGSRGFEAPGVCQLLLPTARPAADINLKQLLVTPDGTSLLAFGQRQASTSGTLGEYGGVLVRYSIDAAGGLTRNTVPSACLDATKLVGCSHPAGMLGSETNIVAIGKHVYMPSSTIYNNGLATGKAAVLNITLSDDGGLAIPPGPAGCVGATTVRLAKVTKLASCSPGRQTLRNLLHLVASPRGNALYALGGVGYDVIASTMLRLGADGVPKATPGPSGCLGTFLAREATKCDAPYAPEALNDADTTLALAPDGHAGYVLSAPIDSPRVSILSIK
jgi:hypothetical protein